LGKWARGSRREYEQVQGLYRNFLELQRVPEFQRVLLVMDSPSEFREVGILQGVSGYNTQLERRDSPNMPAPGGKVNARLNHGEGDTTSMR